MIHLIEGLIPDRWSFSDQVLRWKSLRGPQSFVTQIQCLFCVPPRERQIRCPKCDKPFLRTNHLKKHLNSHEGKRDYVCEKCTKAYLTKYHLTRHLKTCKGPTSGSSAQEDSEDSEEELAGAVGAEACQLSSTVYSADESRGT